MFTSGFVPDLDREIDAWPNALLGFHAIEAKLFGAKRTDVQQETDALIFHLEDLDVKVQHLQLLPQRLLNGMARLAYEIGESKADGGEFEFQRHFAQRHAQQCRWDRVGLSDHFRRGRRGTRSRSSRRRSERRSSELKALVDVPDLKSLEPEKLRAASEELIVVLQMAAPKIGLRSPSLEEIAQ